MVEMLENRVSFLEKMIEKKSFFQTNLEQNRSLQFVLNHSVVHFHCNHILKLKHTQDLVPQVFQVFQATTDGTPLQMIKKTVGEKM